MNRWSRLIAIGLVLCSLAPLCWAQQTAAPYTYATRYNVAGQVTGTIAPDPDVGGPLRYAATRNTYETTGPTAGLVKMTEVGQLTDWANEMVPPSDWSGFTVYQRRTFGYDDQGRKIIERVIGSDLITIESVIQYSYDSWDRVVCKVVRMNPATFAAPNLDACQAGAGPYGPDRVTRFTYDDFDQVLTEERAVGTPEAQVYVENKYHGRGKLEYQIDANDNKTELKYDSNWRLEKRIYPSPTNTGFVNNNDYNGYTYDKNGNVTVERKRNNTTITNSYDANNRLIFKNLSDNTHSGDVSYGYDLRGLTRYACFGTSSTASCDSSGSGETNDFDGFGNVKRRKSRMNGTLREIKYRYDLEGNRTRVTHPDEYYFEYAFDGLNRVDSLRVSLAASPTSGTGSGLTIKYSASGGRSEINRAGTNAAKTAITPNNALRLQSFQQDFAEVANVPTNDLTNTFTYNSAGQVRTLDQSNTSYNYTGAINRTGDYEPNGLNQYKRVDGQEFEYDATGNLVKDRASDGTLTTYTYDMENHLVQVAGPVTGNLTYDVLGRLSRLVSSTGTIDFLYDGDALVAEYLNGALSRRYVHGDQVDEPLIEYQGTNLSTRRYLHADHQGSIIALSNTTGGVTQKNAYDPYGIPASTNDGRFGYTGQSWLKELGLNYYKARIYSPRLGRFLQTDPIFYKDDMNLYAYVANDPTNATDPTGLTIRIGGMSAETHVQVQLDQLRFMDDTSSRDKAQSQQVRITGCIGTPEHCGENFWRDNALGRFTSSFLDPLSPFNDGYNPLSGVWLTPEEQNDAKFMGVLAVATAGAGYVTGFEIKVGQNMRLALFGNRTGHRFGRWPHYHRRGVNASTGETVPGQGIGRHRPWEAKSPDTSFWDRF